VDDGLPSIEGRHATAENAFDTVTFTSKIVEDERLLTDQSK
jgi:hypothetical protein